MNFYTDPLDLMTDTFTFSSCRVKNMSSTTIEIYHDTFNKELIERVRQEWNNAVPEILFTEAFLIGETVFTEGEFIYLKVEHGSLPRSKLEQLLLGKCVDIELELIKMEFTKLPPDDGKIKLTMHVSALGSTSKSYLYEYVKAREPVTYPDDIIGIISIRKTVCEFD